ncbi:hypothetical protein CPC08DRAFT_800674 [Agrocybe pediades]|nr:hypothetical protein CPC08DRAFT_800674 [Agrocybe pediades]
MELDALYRLIISKAEDLPIVLDILAFPVLYAQFDPEDIEAILQLEQGSVEVMLADLHSIVTITYGDVRFLHKSLEDFLSEPQRAGDLYRDLLVARLAHVARVISIFSGYFHVAENHKFRMLPTPLTSYDFLSKVISNSDNSASVNKHAHATSSWFNILFFLHFSPLPQFAIQSQEVQASSWLIGSFYDGWLGNVVVSFVVRVDEGQEFLQPAPSQPGARMLLLYLEYLHHIDVSESTRALYWDQMHQYCEAILAVLDNNWTPWITHFVFMYCHLLHEPRYRLPRKLSHVDFTPNLSDEHARAFGDTMLYVMGVMYDMDSPYPYFDDITKIFHDLIGDAKKKAIFAQAAIFCISLLCDEWSFSQDVDRICGISTHDRRKKRDYPWHWHRMVPRTRSFGNRLALIGYWKDCSQQDYKMKLTRIRKALRATISYRHMAYTQVITMHEYLKVPVLKMRLSSMQDKQPQQWPMFIFLLDLLPEPSHSPTCREAWPKKSRRARQAIDNYLSRMEVQEGMRTSLSPTIVPSGFISFHGNQQAWNGTKNPHLCGNMPIA